MMLHRTLLTTKQLSCAIRSLHALLRPSTSLSTRRAIRPLQTLGSPIQLTRSLSTERNEERKSKAGILGSVAVGASVLFGKAKYVLIGLKLTKLLNIR